MKTSSCKAKGRRLQKAVVELILVTFPHLTERDVQSTSMGVTGEDVKLSEAAYKCVPLAFECKNQEANKSLIKAWEQAESHNPASTATLVVSANNSPVLAVIKLSHLMYLYRRIFEECNGTNKSKD